MPINCIDLFCGCGGMSQGIHDAGVNVLCGIDFWDIAIETYNNNHNNHNNNNYNNHMHNNAYHGICADLTKLDCNDVAKLIGENTHIDLIVGGPPCQGFSMAGKRNCFDPRNSLFREYIRFVAFFKPTIFIIENVAGILTMKSGESKDAILIIDIIIDEFAKIGYTLKYKKLYAPDYGVPQKRRRVFLIGCKIDAKIDNISMIDKITFPSPTHGKSPLIPYVTSGSVLLDKDLIEKRYFHSQKMIDGFMNRLQKNKERGVGFGPQFLDINGQSSTISARYYKDGAEALVKYSDTEVRMLTEREVARIQTFPDSYKFSGSSRNIYTQIGNAVPCLLAKALVTYLISLGIFI
jgi:DNA (cytosine-5)-methyltransferase 1